MGCNWSQCDIGSSIYMGRETKRTRPPFPRNASARAKAMGITWEELARRSGIQIGTLRRILSGQNEGREYNKQAIAAALETTVGELYRGVGSRSKPSPQELKHLIESRGEDIKAEALLPVIDEFLMSQPEIRAAVLATLYDDIDIAKPYLDKASVIPKER